MASFQDCRLIRRHKTFYLWAVEEIFKRSFNISQNSELPITRSSARKKNIEEIKHDYNNIKYHNNWSSSNRWRLNYNLRSLSKVTTAYQYVHVTKKGTRGSIQFQKRLTGRRGIRKQLSISYVTGSDFDNIVIGQSEEMTFYYHLYVACMLTQPLRRLKVSITIGYRRFLQSGGKSHKHSDWQSLSVPNNTAELFPLISHVWLMMTMLMKMMMITNAKGSLGV